MIDADDLEPARCLRLRGVSRTIDGRGQRHGLAEFATIDLAGIQVFDQIGDEAFHVSPPCAASVVRR